jgi:hypothetical protein
MKYIVVAAVLGALIATQSFGALPNTDLPGEPEASYGGTVEWKSHGLDVAGLAESIPGAPDISVFILHLDR